MGIIAMSPEVARRAMEDTRFAEFVFVSVHRHSKKSKKASVARSLYHPSIRIKSQRGLTTVSLKYGRAETAETTPIVEGSTEAIATK